MFVKCALGPIQPTIATAAGEGHSGETEEGVSKMAPTDVWVQKHGMGAKAQEGMGDELKMGAGRERHLWANLRC